MENQFNENQQPVQPPINPQPPVSTSNGLAIAALVCGILGIIGGYIPVVQFFTFVLAIVGIVLGVKGRQHAQVVGSGNGLATAGLVLGIIGTVIGALGILCVVIIGGLLASSLTF